MTWAEFKTWVEAQGVKDEDQIWYIDVTLLTGIDDAELRRTEQGWIIA